MGATRPLETEQLLRQLAADRILVLDGAMGTMIQARDLDEAAFRGARFTHHDYDLSGNNDILVLTAPEEILTIHDAFLEAGSDIITTNTFNANAVSQADYGTEGYVREINYAAASLAFQMAEEWTALTPLKPRFVAGALGPTNKTASLSPDVSDPAYRAITFDDLVAHYLDATLGLLEGGVDLLLIETIFDTLNAKAALFAVEEAFAEHGKRLPIMISGTITDRSGRTLTGQTPGAFAISMGHADAFSIGFNCALGGKELRPHIAEIGRVADTLVCAYPNAGLPNALGHYDETPEETAREIGTWAEDGLVNIVGGCCGTTPDHIRAIVEAVEGKKPRIAPKPGEGLRLSGLEPFALANGAAA